MAAKDNLNVRIGLAPEPFCRLDASFLSVLVPIGWKLEHLGLSLELQLLFFAMCRTATV